MPFERARHRFVAAGPPATRHPHPPRGKVKRCVNCGGYRAREREDDTGPFVWMGVPNGNGVLQTDWAFFVSGFTPRCVPREAS